MPVSFPRVAVGVALCVLVYVVLLSGLNGQSGVPRLEHPSETFERRIVALGDLHGDLPNALTVLQMAGVIDDERKWTGDVDFLVQTGDMIDR